MKVLIIVICLAIARAFSQTDSAAETKLIEAMKQVHVSRIDAQLQEVSLERWLQELLGADSAFSWEVNDCGEETGNPADHPEGDSPTCVEVDAKLKDGRSVVLMLNCGTTKKPDTTNPGLELGQLVSPRATITLRHLSELAAALTKTRS